MWVKCREHLGSRYRRVSVPCARPTPRAEPNNPTFHATVCLPRNASGGPQPSKNYKRDRRKSEYTPALFYVHGILLVVRTSNHRKRQIRSRTCTEESVWHSKLTASRDPSSCLPFNYRSSAPAASLQSSKRFLQVSPFRLTWD